ncbi:MULTISPECIES: flavin reductase family protein [Actinopolyspora]|uniref:Flavin reductase ActVB n=1 Tax=Actinopolyspora saharensis TaxID=995062 RepID=A0A1H0Z322_9ACTN|nr:MULTISPECIES: flavin reductase family protein [Actinopolyspora]NHD16066.1 flavin reductase family protein [Actinopolyspora sp. BKK2]NHE74720.1 flavin reductase family protein [Actinopolyspora sp. BKK1]SDQ21720.1 flavin reductase ActVB [Actinopolyspora saharensis]
MSRTVVTLDSGAPAREEPAHEELVAEFKEAMSSLAAGVCVVTTLNQHAEPIGFAASSVASVSVDPLLLLVCQAKSARSHGVFAECENFAVSVLAAEQRELAERFAKPVADRFSGSGFVAGGRRAPTHPDALARLQCRRVETVDAGDHSILLGRPVEISTTRGDPLVYQARRFRRVEPLTVASSGAGS